MIGVRCKKMMKVRGDCRDTMEKNGRRMMEKGKKAV
jgi:hypothetical protein